MVVRIYDPKFPLDLSGLLDLRGSAVPLDVDDRIFVFIDATDLLTAAVPKRVNVITAPAPPAGTGSGSLDLAATTEIATKARTLLTVAASGAGIFGAIGMRVLRDGAGPAFTELNILSFTIVMDVAYDVYAAPIGAAVFGQQRGQLIVGFQDDTATITEPEQAALAGARANSVFLAGNVPANTKFTYELGSPAIRRGGVVAGEGILVYGLARTANVAVAGDAWAMWRRFTP